MIPGNDVSGATKLERAAGAVDEILSDAFHANRIIDPKLIARAVLRSMRETSDETLDGQCFRDMIDDILTEPIRPTTPPDGEGR